MHQSEKSEQSENMAPKTQTYTIVAGTMKEAMDAVHDYDVPQVGESRYGFMLIEKTATSTNHPDVWTVECTYRNQPNT